MKKSSVRVGANRAQLEAIHAAAKFKTLIWGRGTGKTTYFGIKHRIRLNHLPQAKFAMTAATYKQVLNVSLPAMEDFWNRCGLLEYDFRTKSGHYVVGRKPPPHFAKPIKPPKQYEHIVTFFNGYTIEMMSMDRPSPNRGGSYDGIDADECTLLNWEYFQKVMLPMVRGNVDIFGANNPLHGEKTLAGTMPWLAAGMYVFDLKEKAKLDPGSFYYSEATAHCNLNALGVDYITEQEKTLSPEIFRLEILNQPMISAEHSFYYNFSEDRHIYTPIIYYQTDPNGRGVAVDRSSDYNPEQIIDLTWDFGGWFTGCVVLQQRHDRKDTVRVTELAIDSFSVQKGGSAESVVDQFCAKYDTHKLKYVRVWGEPRGHDKTGFGVTLYDTVVARLKSKGWQVELRAFMTPAHGHDQRFKYMNDILSENRLLPKLRLNRDTCKAPIVAIQSCERTPEGKKDKSMERNRQADQQYAPHFTDALDYFFMQKHYKAIIGLGMEAWVS